MATTRTHTADNPGPTTLDVTLTAGRIHVHVEDRDRAEITISTPDDDGPSADAVTAATVNDQSGRLTARIQHTAGRGIYMQNATGAVFVSGANYGSVVMTGGNVFVDGVRVTAGGAVVVGGQPITVTARLPVGSSLVSSTTSADVATSGRLEAVRAHSVSGDLTVDETPNLDVDTTSGDVTVARFSGRGVARAVSGDVRVHAVEPARLRARTVSGDVRVSGARVELEASSVSGRVTQR